MGIYRHCRHKELPSVREISCRLAAGKSLNSIAEFYMRLESSLPERVHCILGNGSGWRDKNQFAKHGDGNKYLISNKSCRVMSSQLSTVQIPSLSYAFHMFAGFGLA